MFFVSLISSGRETSGKNCRSDDCHGKLYFFTVCVHGYLDISSIVNEFGYASSIAAKMSSSTIDVADDRPSSSSSWDILDSRRMSPGVIKIS